MGVWGDRVVPRLTDRSLRKPAIGELRAGACAPLAGRVLELGFAGGLNIRFYPPAVTSVSAVEPSEVGWGLSERRRARTDIPIERRGLDGQRLDEADASYDSVLSTFTLCTIPDPSLALAEARRVLRSGGVLCVLEHGLAPDARVESWQQRMEPLQRRFAGGCHLTRDIEGLVTEAGFEVTHLETAYLDGPALSRPWTYVYLLTARRQG
ncbi:class I SAM-dependent methyltransferase [Nocardioides sp.]|uniref:class I SAM-dependent methyltransferase n=1 Tax=Nocardioides sp. TaxID=35761 RepID=UPI002ED27E38